MNLNQINGKISRLVDRIKERESRKTMTSLERAQKVYQFQENIGHAYGGFAFWDPRVVGIKDISTKEFYTIPQKTIYCQLYALDLYDHDLPYPRGDVYQIEIEACGTKLEYPEDNMPFAKNDFINNHSDFNNLKFPDPHKDGRMPYIIETALLFKEILGDFYHVSVGTCAPFSAAVGLRGYVNLLKDMKSSPAFVHELLEYTLAVAKSYSKAIIDTLGIAPSPADAWASLPHINLNQFYEFALPYATRLLSFINGYSNLKSTWNLGWGFSLPQDQEMFLRTFNATGTATCNIFGEDILGRNGYKKIDLERTKDICYKQRVVLSTNPIPQSVFDGPPKIISDNILEWHNICKKNGGHMIYTNIPLNTPTANIKAFVETLKKCKY